MRLVVPRRALLALAANPKLADLLGARDAAVLTKPILNIPPEPFAFPEWIEGEWDVTKTFAGYELCARRIPRDRLVRNLDIPGFQKLSIADIADVGKDVTFRRSYNSGDVAIREDRCGNLERSIDAHLGSKVVRRVVETNANRVTIELEEGYRNGERVELFTNSRRTQLDGDVFYAAESIRQVTLGGPTLSNPGVARVVIGEYQHFWTLRRGPPITANVITCAYIQPQDPMFVDAYNEPVVVYSHNLGFTNAIR